MVNRELDLNRLAEDVLRQILANFGDLKVTTETKRRSQKFWDDLVVVAKASDTDLRFAIETKSRITPQTAAVACERMARVEPDWIGVLFAPVISERVAEIAKKHGVSFFDGAGNCWLKSRRHHLYIERKGLQTERRKPAGRVDPFSPKSSRIVRALLANPTEQWQVRPLAEHPDVRVSVGLVVKVKRALIEEGYAFEFQKRLTLLDPIGLLENWVKKYRGPMEQIPLYVRGELESVEQRICDWCRQHDLQHALAGFSAAWRLAPDVRYSVATVFVEERGFDQQLLNNLSSQFGAKRVETGHNLLLWRAFDSSVFAPVTSSSSSSADLPVTSALQSYLDLKHMAGRGDEAADAIFEKYLREPLHSAAVKAKELHDAQA